VLCVKLHVLPLTSIDVIVVLLLTAFVSVGCFARAHCGVQLCDSITAPTAYSKQTTVPVVAAAVAEQPLQPLVPGTGSVLGDILAGAAISAGALVPLAAVAGCAQIACGAQETALAEVTV
jgi:hypothetical protein